MLIVFYLVGGFCFLFLLWSVTFFLYCYTHAGRSEFKTPKRIFDLDTSLSQLSLEGSHLALKSPLPVARHSWRHTQTSAPWYLGLLHHFCPRTTSLLLKVVTKIILYMSSQKVTTIPLQYRILISLIFNLHRKVKYS